MTPAAHTETCRCKDIETGTRSGIGAKRKETTMSREATFEIIEEIGIVGTTREGYSKKLVFTKWYDKPPIYEIRTFAPDGTPKKRPGMTHDELAQLRDMLNSMDL